ncbi:Zinc finger MYM-type protein 6-like [Oopsacas minuta]|uniref:Zinc finger MYM-type protein 6-like n=1 Tax=Oopsacas minuta TaxID=111878 RepID=A0AAV7K4G4_9METZ|nr:Zinc finger MYM-type protein 6-like [Oopsacas minuta]
MNSKKKCRQYSADYIKYGFVKSPSNEQLPMCLLCEQVFSNEGMKPARMIDHLKSRHSDKVEKDVQFFIKMRDSRKTMGGIFGKIDRQNIDGLVASYNISLLIAKSGKPHTMGENFILPAIQEAVTTVMHSDGRSVIKSIPLSNDTVARRINLMASDVEKTLYSILKTTEFSLQIDESTLPGNEALLLAYVRYILEGIMVEEMLFARPLVTDTKGESIYKVVENFFQEKEIPMNNIIACATDGAPAMVEVRWLSKGKCLSRFYSLFDTILEFLEEENPQLMQLVSAAKSDVAYLTDIFDKFNAMNLQLQGNLVTLVKCKTVVSSCIGKLTLFKQNIGRREFYQFPHLAGLQISDDDLLAYCEHLEVLKADMIKRFTDLLELEPPHWLIDPFCVAAPTVPLYLQEELMDLQSDCEEKAHFTMMGYERFWIAIAGRNKFPNLWKVAKLLVLAFPTSYLVERGFSAVVQLLTKQRNRLDISQCGDLRLLLTDMKPDINGIIDEHHAQVHPSH